MRAILKNHTIRKGLLLYRKLRYRKGFGVHSPFVFKFITQVIEEKRAYYSYEDIDLERKKLFHNTECFSSHDIGTWVRKYDLKKKEGELLFRLANFFKPTTIILIAPSELFSVLYLTAYRQENIHCSILQNDSTLYALSDKLYPDLCPHEIFLTKGEYEKFFSSLLQQMPSPDLIYIDAIKERDVLEQVWKTILSYKQINTVCVIKGIHHIKQKKELWRKICTHPETTVTIDLYSYGIILFNKKWHKRSYKVNF